MKKETVAVTLSLIFLFCITITPFFVQKVFAENHEITVGFKQAPPFTIKNDKGEWEGISIELWQEIASELKLSYEINEYSLKDLQTSLKNKSIDVAVAALTITEDREKKYDFTHPFYTTGLGIAVKFKQKSNVFALLARLFSTDFLKVIGLLVLTIGIVGTLVWVFEREKNQEQFGGKPHHGIGAGFWWSAVTMTTVGYGDKAPKTIGGRIVGLIWMFMAIIMISGFTASITTSLTVNQLSQTVKGPEDLVKVRVGTIEHSTSEASLINRKIVFQKFATVKDGLLAIVNNEIDALVYDAPLLRYYSNKEFRGKVKVLKNTFEQQQYGFGLTSGSELREPINRVLLKKIAAPEWKDILYRYIGIP
ncbi:transporter substrate-binding domain-containing protein [Patescibacteria group bacterium]|nr:transporter substrate-binding domain-containing protein [Patescibacteria group bacterium]